MTQQKDQTSYWVALISAIAGALVLTFYAIFLALLDPYINETFKQGVLGLLPEFIGPLVSVPVIYFFIDRRISNSEPTLDPAAPDQTFQEIRSLLKKAAKTASRKKTLSVDQGEGLKDAIAKLQGEHEALKHAYDARVIESQIEAIRLLKESAGLQSVLATIVVKEVKEGPLLVRATLTQICKLLVKASSTVTAAASIWVYDEKADVLRKVAHFNCSDESRIQTLKPGEGFAGAVYNANDWIFISDLRSATSTPFVPFSEDHPDNKPRSIMGRPVSSGHTGTSLIRGVICLSERLSSDTGKLTSGDQTLLKIYANMVTAVLTIADKRRIDL